jgi:hypothetical protein
VTATVVLEREMGCTREELARWLPGATRHAPVRPDGDELVFAVGRGQVRLRAVERPPRRIALIEVPVLAVRFAFVGVGEADRREFLEWFDAYTRRGGG